MPHPNVNHASPARFRTASRCAFALLCALSAIALVISAPAPDVAAHSAQASATLVDLQGDPIGTVSFAQVQDGVAVLANLVGLAPGFHGFHIHANASCDAETAFQSAGAHWSLAEVAGVQTGDAMPPMASGHTGDLTNLYVASSGVALLSFVEDKFTVDELLADGGHAVVVHAAPDNFTNIPPRYGVSPDQTTLDTGDAGARIACGIIGPA